MGAIEAFVVVAQNRTLTAASHELNLSVSAISRRIQALETYVGAPLFERLHHELRLTPHGERLVENATPVVDALSQVLADLRHDGVDRLTIGVPPSFAAAWLLPRLTRFKTAYPGIDLTFDSAGAPLPRLGAGLDAAIVFGESVASELHARVLKPQTAFAVCAPGFLDPDTTPGAALAAHSLLLHSSLPKVLPCWLEAVGLGGLTPRRIDYYDSGPMLIAAAESRLGIALTLEDTVNFLAGARIERPFGEAAATPYSYYFVCRRPALARRGVRRFHDWLFDEMDAGTDIAENAKAFA